MDLFKSEGALAPCPPFLMPMIYYIYIYISLGTLVPNSRDRQGKLWLPKKQKTALKTTLQ